MLTREIFETGLSETPFSAFPGPDFITYDRNDNSFPIILYELRKLAK